VSLRILFADDSVTAQNMGRKILTDAGYEVVAVSNGAAAVKKIAEQKPDIIILDVYMPGYSGLEVCEKVRGSVATLKTPVLLTVGKMEPYRAEETKRVRADGVIVKPFEASDLLAIVKQFEERIGQAPAVPEPVAVEPSYETAPEELPPDPPEPIVTKKTQATVDVPDHMATSSAFSDLLGTDSAHSMNNFSAPPPPAPRATPPAPTPIRTPIPEYVAPDSWRDKIDGETEPFTAAVPATPEASDTAIPETNSRPPMQIPVYQEHEETLDAAEVLPTAAPPIGDIEIPREPELQESAAEQTRSTVADAREPGLIPTVHEEIVPPTQTAQTAATEEAAPVESAEIPAPSFAEALAAAGGPAAEMPVVAPVADTEEVAPVVAEAEQSAVTDSDFEARVAAAMAAYSHAPANETSPEPAAVHAEPAPPVSDRQAPPAVMGAAPAESAYHKVSTSEAPAPSVDYYPPAAYTEAAPGEKMTPGSAVHSPVAQAPSQEQEKEPTPAEVDHQEAAPVQVDQVVAASVEAAMPAVATAAAGASAGTDHHTIAQAVHRVMERLKPELVEEIMRELKPKE
jgi:CheY-like chemotaxis protein